MKLEPLQGMPLCPPKQKRSEASKAKGAARTALWKEVKKEQGKASLLGHLILESFQEVTSSPPRLQVLAKGKASAFLEYHFFQEALARPIGQPPNGHCAEYQHRVNAAINIEIAAKWEAYRSLCYKFAYLEHGILQTPGQEQMPKWAPGRVQQQLKSMGPKLRTVPVAIVCLKADAVSCKQFTHG